MPENEEIKQLLSGSCNIPSGRSSGITKTNEYQNKNIPSSRHNLEPHLLRAKLTTAHKALWTAKECSIILFLSGVVSKKIKLVFHLVLSMKAHKCSHFSCLTLLTDIHYFHCLRIVEILKGTEASSKNIFGRYSSQRMKVGWLCYLTPNKSEMSFLYLVPLLLKY